MDNGASSYRRFLDGEKNALIEIVRDYKDGLMLFLYGFVKNIDIAEELTQETFIKLYVKKPRFNGKSSFKTWLYRIGRNTAVDYIRHVSKADVVALENSTDIADISESVESAYLKRQDRIIVHKALRRLKPEYYQVLWLVYFEDMRNEEVAGIMKKRSENISVLLHRAKKSLKNELLKENFDYENL